MSGHRFIDPPFVYIQNICNINILMNLNINSYISKKWTCLFLYKKMWKYKLYWLFSLETFTDTNLFINSQIWNATLVCKFNFLHNKWCCCSCFVSNTIFVIDFLDICRFLQRHLLHISKLRFLSSLKTFNMVY